MYITADDLAASFSLRILTQLSNDNPAATSPDYAVVERVIKMACERIDTALRSRYVLPLAYQPTTLFLYAECLARYWLYARRPETKMPEPVKENFTWAMGELEKIQNGKLHLGLAEVPKGSAAEGADTKGSDVNNTTANTPVGSLYPDDSEYEVRAKMRLNTEGY